MTQEKKKKKRQPDTRPIPKFYTLDEKGKKAELQKLKKAAFPKTKEGQMAFCDYMIEKWGAKKEKIKSKKALDPLSKLQRKKERMQAKLEQVSKELAELEGAQS